VRHDGRARLLHAASVGNGDIVVLMKVAAGLQGVLCGL